MTALTKALARGRWAGLRWTACALAGLPGTAAAQDCFPAHDSHEAQLFAAFAVPLAFSLAEAPQPMDAGRIRVGLEGTYLPKMDAEIRTPTTCRPGKGPEDTDLLFALPRPRAALGLPAGFVLEASWVPPIEVNGAKANLVGLSLLRTFPLGGKEGALLAARIHSTFGLIRAPITCNDDALRDPLSECFQGTRSSDRYHPNVFGLEGAVSWPLAGGRLRPFLGGGVNVLHPRFQVNFTNQFGSTDNRRVTVDLARGALFGGATWAPAPRLGLSGEIYGSPGDAVTGRVALSYQVR